MGSWNHSLYYTCGKVVEFSLVRKLSSLQPTPKFSGQHGLSINSSETCEARTQEFCWWPIMDKRPAEGTILMGSGRVTDSKAIQFISMFLVSNFIVDLQKCVKKYKRKRDHSRNHQLEMIYCYWRVATGLFRCFQGCFRSRSSHSKWQ